MFVFKLFGKQNTTIGRPCYGLAMTQGFQWSKNEVCGNANLVTMKPAPHKFYEWSRIMNALVFGAFMILLIITYPLYFRLPTEVKR